MILFFAVVLALVEFFVVVIRLEHARSMFEIEVPAPIAVVALRDVPLETLVDVIRHPIPRVYTLLT